MLVVDLAARVAKVVDRVVHVLGVPEHKDVEREPERGELVSHRGWTGPVRKLRAFGTLARGVRYPVRDL